MSTRTNAASSLFAYGRDARPPEDDPQADATEGRPWTVPLLFVLAAAALVVIALAGASARSGGSRGEALLWLGLVVLIVPVFAALASGRLARAERFALAAGLGLSLYVVKVMRDPFGFTFADELVHVTNANAVVGGGSLFAENAILPVTPLYPGLEAVTAAVAGVAGIGTFAAGITVIATARLLLVASLFLLFERISGSSRVAGLGAAAYSANPNFLFFNAQYAYESLALPLLVFCLAALSLWRDRTSAHVSRTWAFVGLGAVAGVVLTHHMTSYALIGIFALVALLASLLRDSRAQGQWLFLVAAVAGTTVWLFVVARETLGYVSPVITSAIASTLDAISREGPTREMFSGGDGGGAAEAFDPAWQRPVAIGSVLLLLIIVPLGLRIAIRRRLSDPFVIALGLMAVSYFGTFGARFVPAAWETANRAASFLFLGVAFFIGLAGTLVFEARRFRIPAIAAAAGACALIFAGGFIAGWPAHLRLPYPYRVDATTTHIHPEGVAAAEWVRAHLGPGVGMATDDSNARLQMAYAGSFAIAGRNPDVQTILRSEPLDQWMVNLLADQGLDFVLVDRRRIAFDPMMGYFFADRRLEPIELVSREHYEKFDRRGAVSRLYDSGAIAIYDVRALTDAPER